MTKINLLAVESVKKEERTGLVVLLYAFIGLFVLFAAMQYLLKFRTLNRLQTRLELTKQELTRYESIVKQVEALQSTKAVLEAKKNVINSLMLSRLFYPQFMENILRLLPSNVWFKTITTKLSGMEKMTVDLDAEAIDVYSIADFISALVSNADFSNTELKALTTQYSEKTQTSTFRLSFDYEKKKS